MKYSMMEKSLCSYYPGNSLLKCPRCQDLFEGREDAILCFDCMRKDIIEYSASINEQLVVANKELKKLRKTRKCSHIFDKHYKCQLCGYNQLEKSIMRPSDWASPPIYAQTPTPYIKRGEKNDTK